MPYDTDNIFARILRGEMPAFTVYENDHCLALLDVMPQSDGHTLVYSYNPMNGISNKVFHIVYATAGEKTGDFDRNEIQEIAWLSKKEAREMLRGQQIKDGLALTALFLYLGSK